MIAFTKEYYTSKQQQDLTKRLEYAYILEFFFLKIHQHLFLFLITITKIYVLRYEKQYGHAL